MRKLLFWQVSTAILGAIFLVGWASADARASPDKSVATVTANDLNLEIKGLTPPDSTETLVAKAFVTVPDATGKRRLDQPTATRGQPAVSHKTMNRENVTDTGHGRVSNTRKLGGAARHPLKCPT